MAEPVRLQRFLAAAGVAARRKAEQLILAGRVNVNGVVVRVLGTKIDPEHDSITVDGEAVSALDKFYVLLNKPKACITAVTDDRGRPTVMDYLPNAPVPVKPVGRLDFYTEGVLLLTNDGELAARLLAPASHVAKTYHAKVHGKVTPDDLKRLRTGIELDDGTVTLPAEVALLPSESRHSWVAITVHEGKHHQIHRMLEALGFRIDKLQRVAFANLTFHHLRVGDARELTQQELNGLRDLVGLDHSTIARGKWRASREATDIPRRARAKARAEAEAVVDERVGWAPDPEDDVGPPGEHERDARRERASRGGDRGERGFGSRGTGEQASRGGRGGGTGERAPRGARGGGSGERAPRGGRGGGERAPRGARSGVYGEQAPRGARGGDGERAPRGGRGGTGERAPRGGRGGSGGTERNASGTRGGRTGGYGTRDGSRSESSRRDARGGRDAGRNTGAGPGTGEKRASGRGTPKREGRTSAKGQGRSFGKRSR